MAITKLSLALLALAGSALGADLPSIEIKGAKFFYPNGTQFFLRGVAYQQDTAAAGATSTNAKVVDPLADETRCKRDIPNLVELKTNVIRTYAIDPTADHSACMQMLMDAGIYVISDLGQPDISINREDPQWNVELSSHFESVIDSFAKYSNVIGFFAGNEVSNNSTYTPASAYAKAAVRDMKKYIKSKNYRSSLAVGYAADDGADIRTDVAKYFNCGDSDDSIDFFGYNVYEWCGETTFEKSGYNRIIETFTSWNVPVFFAEYGCNTGAGGAAGRMWQDTTALYTNNMTDVINGGIVFEYFEEANDFGLFKDSTEKKLADFSTLATKMKSVDPKGVSMSDYNPTNKAQTCPSTSADWAASDSLPPTPNKDACDCMAKAADCAVSDKTDVKDYGAIFNYICAYDGSICDGIQGNATTGKYGTYSMCNPKEQLTYVLNKYYAAQNKASDACSFKGKAETQTSSGDTNCDSMASSGNSNSNSNSSSSDDQSAATTPATNALIVGSMALLGALVSTGMISL